MFDRGMLVTLFFIAIMVVPWLFDDVHTWQNIKDKWQDIFGEK
jgi:hypothetical protein